MKLNDTMQFGHVIHVHPDGTITHPHILDAPESVYVDLDADGQMIGSDSRDGADVLAFPVQWKFMHGYTSQHGATSRSFIMHASESIGAAMERDILHQPGLYAAVTVEGLPDDAGDPDDDATVGWAVVFREVSETDLNTMNDLSAGARALKTAYPTLADDFTDSFFEKAAGVVARAVDGKSQEEG